MNANEVLEHYKNTFTDLIPAIRSSRNWKARGNFQNKDLENGHITFLYQGEGGEDPTQMYIGFLIIARKYCGKSAQGRTIEVTELELLNQIRQVIDQELPQIHIKKVSSSQQQECPDAWIICECQAGPFDFSVGDDWLGEDLNINKFSLSQSPDIGIPHKDKYIDVEELE